MEWISSDAFYRVRVGGMSKSYLAVLKRLPSVARIQVLHSIGIDFKPLSDGEVNAQKPRLYGCFVTFLIAILGRNKKSQRVPKGQGFLPNARLTERD